MTFFNRRNCVSGKQIQIRVLNLEVLYRESFQVCVGYITALAGYVPWIIRYTRSQKWDLLIEVRKLINIWRVRIKLNEEFERHLCISLVIEVQVDNCGFTSLSIH